MRLRKNGLMLSRGKALKLRLFGKELNRHGHSLITLACWAPKASKPSPCCTHREVYLSTPACTMLIMPAMARTMQELRCQNVLMKHKPGNETGNDGTQIYVLALHEHCWARSEPTKKNLMKPRTLYASLPEPYCWVWLINYRRSQFNRRLAVQRLVVGRRRRPRSVATSTNHLLHAP